MRFIPYCGYVNKLCFDLLLRKKMCRLRLMSFSVSRITEDEYIELTSLIEEVYGATTQ